MSVELSVKDVREALQRAAGPAAAGEGEPATLLLGRVFHEVFADLVSASPERSGIRVLLESGLERELWRARLIEHAYRALVGPRLAAHQAHLHQTTEQVLSFWKAVQSLCGWLGDVTGTVVEARQPRTTGWDEVARILQAEVALTCELRAPGWSDSVRLSGISDSMVRLPGSAHWCAIELKLGRTAPVIDLGQAALYHLIARRSAAPAPPSASKSALALLRFTPALEETFVSVDQASEAEGRLIALIGKLAGVARPAAVAASKPPPPPIATPIADAPPPAHEELGKRLVRALREYGRPIELAGAPAVGPRFLRFEARLGAGVLFEQVRRLSSEVQIKMGLQRAPIIAKSGGRLTIEVERDDPQTILFSHVAPQLGAVDPLRGSARMPVGVDVAGTLRFADLSSPVNAHVLVAGTTGSGKTEWLRAAIAGLIRQNTPDTLRLVLIDPKMIAFGDLRRSPFLWPKYGFWVPGEGMEVVEIFEELVAEMDRRYQLIRKAGADHLGDYVERTGAPIPRLVCVCDEYFALISRSKAERAQIEEQVFLLGAKARAAGIHLVLATQQPSREVIRGALDTNMPCRVGLYLQNAIESRMLLQSSGAEQLTGKGDLLYKDIGEPLRLQAPFVAPDERAQAFGLS